MLKVIQGQIVYYRVFDLGSDVNYSQALETLQLDGRAIHFSLKKTTKAMVIADAPLVLSLGNWDESWIGQNFQVSAIGKLWSFGALSISIRIYVQNPISIDEFSELSKCVLADSKIEQAFLEKAKTVISDLHLSMTDNTIWDQSEDYVIYKLDKIEGHVGSIAEIVHNVKIQSLLIGDTLTNPSEGLKQSFLTGLLQYDSTDLVLLDWNAGLIIDTQDAQDISDVVEFALSQLLELRYYDHLLDLKLATLYKSIARAESSVFQNRYMKLSSEAALLYIEISEVVEKIENSLKVIGDIYLAKVYRLANEKFRVKDWQQSVDNKLTNLAQISQLFQGEIDHRRSMYLEVIIIVLIAIEVIPFIWSVSKEYFGF